MFGSRFIDSLKSVKEGQRKKSRLIAQNYKDENSRGIYTRAPTVQRLTQLLLLSLAASMPDMNTFRRDVTEAYVQSETKFALPVYIQPPPKMVLTRGTVWRVVKPLYGIPESGLHWYFTYLQHH